MKYDIKALSIHRSALMGFAMLWVVLYHYQMNGFLSYPMSLGFTGVDIFLLVSSFGLYYSMHKNDNTLLFWKRRLIRIFPTYIIIGIATCLLTGYDTVLKFFWNYSTIGFWANQECGWFVSSIVFLYFLFPFLYFTIFKSSQLKILIPIAVLLFFFICYNCFVDRSIMDTNHFLLLYRIPIFIIGALLAHIENTPPIQPLAYRYLNGGKLLLLFIALLLLFLIVMMHFMKGPRDEITVRSLFFSTTFIAPIIIYALLLVFERVRLLSKTLAVVGEASFEIFLLHGMFLKILGVNGVPSNFYKILICIVCVISCILLHRVFSMLTRRIQDLCK